MVLNLAASAGTMDILSLASQLPLDDRGIQGAIAVVIELIDLCVIFSEGWVGWFSRVRRA